MFITVEMIKKCKPCDKGMSFVTANYPNGFESSQLVLDENVPRELIHWAKANLPHTEEEARLYEKRMNIRGCNSYYYCHNLINTDYARHSWDITDSAYVINSQQVKQSHDIVACESVENSFEIYLSQFIFDSHRIYDSRNVTLSSNIVSSSVVANSKNVGDSIEVFDSSEIVLCKQVSSCGFCVRCENLKNCLFCCDLKDTEYCIFNTPVSKERFELFMQQYKKIFTSELTLCLEWPEQGLLTKQVPKKTNNYFEYFQNIDLNLLKWASTLPNYSSNILYKSTLLPNLLVAD